MYALIGLLVGVLLSFVVNKMKVIRARKHMEYIPESKCWIPKESVRETKW